MEITTKDIIKILSFDDTFKMDLLRRFDTLPPDEKYRIEQILWDTFDGIYEARLQENMDAAYHNASLGKEKLDTEFMSRIHDKTEKQLQKEIHDTVNVTDLSTVRSAIEKIVNEIQASKSLHSKKA